MECKAEWFEWNGKEFASEWNEVISLPLRETPKTYQLTLPSGLVLKVKRFDRAGRPQTRFRHYYGGNTTTRKYIDIRVSA